MHYKTANSVALLRYFITVVFNNSKTSHWMDVKISRTATYPIILDPRLKRSRIVLQG